MRAWGCSLLLIGCTEPLQAVDDWGALDGADLLVDEPEHIFAERVTLRGSPRARLIPDGLTLSNPYPNRWLPPLVVVDPTPWPRVILEAGDVQVLVYVERSALQPWVVQTAQGTGPDGHGLVRFAPGVGVERLQEDEAGRVQVRADFDDFEVEAWVPRGVIDEVWREGEPSFLENEPAAGAVKALVSGAVLLDRPGGAILATVTSEDPMAVVRVDEARASRGYLPAVLWEHNVRVEGWIHEDDVQERTRFSVWARCGGGHGFGSQGHFLTGPQATVPAGAWLRAGEDGPVVARALQDLPVPLSAREEGATIERGTWLGRVALWVDPRDVL